MADTPNVKDLEMRIVELENRFKELQPSSPPEEVTPEDIKSYHKVTRALGCCQNNWVGASGAGARFGGLGGSEPGS